MRLCVHCGHNVPPDKLQCPSCKQWNTRSADEDGTVTLNTVKPAGKDRIYIGDWGMIWGRSKKPEGGYTYGVVRTSTTIIGGKPGAGKSTLLLQICDAVCRKYTKAEVLYIASEEADEELKERADRLEVEGQDRIRIAPAMSGAVDINEILSNRKPTLTLLDSLAGLTGEEQETQIKVCQILKEFSVRYRAPTIMVTHVTKDDSIAGLMALQHVVDTVMTFFPDEEGERYLEVVKNRNGKAHIGLPFDMTPTGLNLGLETDEIEAMIDGRLEDDEEE